jgi:hypothetical protein
MCQALLSNRALGAEGLGGLFAGGPSRSALRIGVVEDIGIGATALSQQLPVPEVGVWTG